MKHSDPSPVDKAAAIAEAAKRRHGTRHERWKITTPAGLDFEVIFNPHATGLEVSWLYPGARIEPMEPFSKGRK